MFTEFWIFEFTNFLFYSTEIKIYGKIKLFDD